MSVKNLYDASGLLTLQDFVTAKRWNVADCLTEGVENEAALNARKE